MIEDAAQAHGAEYKGKPAGSLGDMGCFSFYPGKNLGAYGEGGMVVTNNPEFVRTIKMLRDWGAEKKYQHVLKGYNYRLEGMQGAVLRVKLRHLEGWTQSRRENAAIYNRLLAGSERKDPSKKCLTHATSITSMRFARPNGMLCSKRCMRKASNRGIHYPIPVHSQPAYADLGYQKGDFPHSEKAANEVLSLPMFAELTQEQIEVVATTLQRCLYGQPG